MEIRKPPQDLIQKHTNEVRTNLNEIVETIADGNRRIIIYRYNDPKAVLLSRDDYEWLALLENSILEREPELFTDLYTKWKDRKQAREDSLREKRELEESLRKVQERLRRLEEQETAT